MDNINVFLFIFNIIIFILNLYLFLSYANYRRKQKQNLSKELQIFSNETNKLQKKKKDIETQILLLETEQQKIINKYVETETEKAENQLNVIRQKTSQQAIALEEEFNNYKAQIDAQKIELQKDLSSLKKTLNAGNELRIKQQQQQDKIDFYKLSLSGPDLEDVLKLQKIKSTLSKPVILSKLIWTQYFQKQMNELCDRVLGKNIVSGIYKITNILDNKCYIGQSVNVQQRLKQHCKCGLGIDASATNKLYNAMQEHGVWNFTFELIEECPRNLLNEKEKFWIEAFESNKYGHYNSTGGNK